MSATNRQAQLDAGYASVKAVLEELRPLLEARIAEIVRAEHPTAVAIWLEPTDQNHYGWVLIDIELEGGVRVRDDDLEHDALWPHLDNLGADFLSSDSNPYPYRFVLEEATE